jgi:NADPH-dependent curcumin reductase CurA
MENPQFLPLTTFLGPLGTPGFTAYSSLFGIGKPKKGETLYVSAAAGGVGQVVGQLAKIARLRVIDAH